MQIPEGGKILTYSKKKKKLIRISIRRKFKKIDGKTFSSKAGDPDIVKEER